MTSESENQSVSPSVDSITPENSSTENAGGLAEALASAGVEKILDADEATEDNNEVEQLNSIPTQIFQKDKWGRMYATGRRKNSVARAWIKRGSGKITINGKDADAYFGRPVLRMLLRQGLGFTQTEDKYDIMSTVKGGGLSGQAGALRHAISTALARIDGELRTTLKKNGLLTRDSRVVERKKYGRAKARKSFQFSKR